MTAPRSRGAQSLQLSLTSAPVNHIIQRDFTSLYGSNTTIIFIIISIPMT